MTDKSQTNKGKRIPAGLLRPIPVFFIVTALSALVYGIPALSEVIQSTTSESYGHTNLILHLLLPIATGLMAALGVYFGFAEESAETSQQVFDRAEYGDFTSDERARAVIRHLPTAAITLDLEGEITFHNPAASDLFEVDIEHDHEQVMTLLQSAGLALNMEEIKSGNTIVMEKRWTNPATPGVDTVWKIIGTPVTRHDETAEILLLFEDITQVRKLEDDLVRSEDRYRNIFNHAPCGIFFVDSDGHYLDANPAALEMLGYRLDEITKLSTREVSADTDRRLRRLRETAGWVEEDTRYLSKDGKVVEAELIASSYQSGSETYFVGIAKDVTASKELERSLADAKTHLKVVLSMESRPLILLDGDEKVTNVNASAAKILQCEADALLGVALKQLVPGDKLEIQDPSTASAVACTFQIPGGDSLELTVIRLPLGSSSNPGSLLLIS
jgi:PAS domain S-box-containing protein